MKSLAAGVRLGPYEILSRVGAGGMGEVWKARDTRLDREVAIKISAERFTDRFEREAHAIAALNHAGICTLFDVGPDYLVMELVDGPTLAERIGQGPMPLEEALAIAKQISDALDAAHEKGIVHRDLKPGNIKIRPDGSVKVLDFGLAKAVGGAAGTTDDSPTELQTQAGVILGTAAYMAPEQARGKPVDKRADIWAFGVVFYEMLAGRRLFKGDDLTDTLSAVIRSEPDLTAAPRQVRRLLERCLQKDPKKRLRDISDAWNLLDEGSPQNGVPTPKRTWLPWTVASFSLVGLAALSVPFFSRNAPADAAATRFTIPPPAGATFTGYRLGYPAVSPDGRHLLFGAARSEGTPEIWVRALDAVTARPVPGTRGGSDGFWSPDSKSIGFFSFSENKLKRVDLSGGGTTTLADSISETGGAWSQEGVIVFAPNWTGPLYRVAASGGPPSPVTRLDVEAGETSHRNPSFLPDGTHFLYSALKASNQVTTIRLGSLDSPAESRVLVEGSSRATYAQGYLIYLQASTLMARQFDPTRFLLTGEARTVAESVAVNEGYSVCTNGVLAYVSATPPEFTWLDRTGKSLAVLGVHGSSGGLGRIVFSPDGKAATSVVVQGGNRDIWIHDLLRGLPTRFTFDPGNDDDGVWSPDGKAIVFDSNRKGVADLYVKAVDGPAGSEQLLYADNVTKFPMSFSPDGKYLSYFSIGDPKTGSDIWLLPDPLGPPGTSKPFPFLRTERNEFYPMFSPDGKWIAYGADESGSREIYVAPFPGPGGRRRVSVSGGELPRWRGDGTELFYRAPDGNLMVAAIASRGGQLDVAKVSLLLGGTVGFYDVSPDGQQLLVLIRPEGSADRTLTVVQNWTAELEK